MLNKIFINYRRDDSSWPTQMIHNFLNERYANLVFKDLNITGGENFEKRIEKELLDCKIFISVINKSWLYKLKEKEGKMIDYVVLEIEIALKRNKDVIPVLIDDTLMPLHNELPESIKDLHLRNGVRISLKNFNTDIYILCEHINKKLRNSEPLKKVLLLDESGARGSITLGMLERLEKMLNQHPGQVACLADHFDLIVSSGASSLIATCLALGYSIKDTYGLYHSYITELYRKQNNIFGLLHAAYDSRFAKDLLKKTFKSISLDDEGFKTKLGIFAYDIDSEQVTIFTNLEIPSLSGDKNILISDIIFCSSVIPTHHKPIAIPEKNNHRCVAGSIGLSNDLTLGTALFIQSENNSINWNMNADQLLFVTIGRGFKSIISLPPENISIIDWAKRLSLSILINFTKVNNGILAIVARVIYGNKSKSDKNSYLADLGLESFLFTLAKIDVNLDDRPGFRNDDFFETNSKSMPMLYEIGLKETALVEELNTLKRYFE